MGLEQHNLSQIQRLNQRGGRTLSIVDLMNDGTISAEMAGFCWLVVAGGDSFLTGAVPGGVGKTTLMATLLGFLPPGERIVTVAGRDVLAKAEQGAFDTPATLLAHEIGSGHWFGYIWGREAADFFRLGNAGFRPVSCIHADDPDQSWDSLSSLGVSEEAFRRVRLQLYMVAERGPGGLRRRVRGVYYEQNGRHTPLYEWLPGDDEFVCARDREEMCAMAAETLGVGADQADACWRESQRLLGEWRDDGPHRFEQVRARVVEEYKTGIMNSEV